MSPTVWFGLWLSLFVALCKSASVHKQKLYAKLAKGRYGKRHLYSAFYLKLIILKSSKQQLCQYPRHYPFYLISFINHSVSLLTQKVAAGVETLRPKYHQLENAVGQHFRKQYETERNELNDLRHTKKFACKTLKKKRQNY